MSIENISIIGTAIFGENSQNGGIVDNGIFQDSSTNSGTVSTASFSGSSINGGTVTIAKFKGSSSNSGSITQLATFSDTTINTGSVSGTVTFTGSASNTGGTIQGNAVFSNTTFNTGTVSEAFFMKSANNTGTITGSAVFADTSINGGLVQGNAIFSDSTTNTGTVNGDAQIASTANNSTGTVSGNITLYTHPDGYFPNGYYSGGIKTSPLNYDTIVYQVGNFWYKYDALGNGELAFGNYSDGTSMFTFDNGVKGAAYIPIGNWYDDSSASAHPVSFNGTQSNKGAVFNGSAQLTVLSSEDFAFGTGDFTIEGWIKQNNTSRQDWFVLGNVANNTNRIQFLYDGVNVGYFNNSQPVAVTAFAISSAAWYHVALSRSNNTSRVYVNGVKIAENTDNTNYTANDFRMGDQFDGGSAMNGSVAGVRIIKGSGLYTELNYTIPTELPTAISGTVLLLNFGATGVPVSYNWYYDTSTAAHTVTSHGALTLFEEDSGVRAAVFDGSSGYLSVQATGSEFDLSSGDSTIEFWVKPETNVYGVILYGGDGTTFNIHMYDDGNVHVNNGAVGDVTIPVRLNEWQHIAVVFYNGQKYVYSTGTLSVSSSQLFGATNTIYVGNKPSEGRFLDGCIAGLRIVKGTALYTSNFSAPTAVPTNVSGTELLLNFGATAAPIYNIPPNGWDSVNNIYFLNGIATPLDENGETTWNTSDGSYTPWNGLFYSGGVPYTGTALFGQDEYGNWLNQVDFVNGVEVYRGPKL